MGFCKTENSDGSTQALPYSVCRSSLLLAALPASPGYRIISSPSSGFFYHFWLFSRRAAAAPRRGAAAAPVVAARAPGYQAGHRLSRRAAHGTTYRRGAPRARPGHRRRSGEGPAAGTGAAPRPRAAQPPRPPELNKTNILCGLLDKMPCFVEYRSTRPPTTGTTRLPTTTRGARGPRSGHRRYSGEGPTGAPGGRSGTRHQGYEEPGGASAALAAPPGGFAAWVA